MDTLNRTEHYNFVERHENIKSDVVRLAIFESLQWKWYDMYERRESADCHELSEAEFMATILNIEDMDNAERAAAKKNPNSTNASRKRGSGDRGSSSTNERNKNKIARHFCMKEIEIKEPGASVRSLRSWDIPRRHTCLMIKQIARRQQKPSLAVAMHPFNLQSIYIYIYIYI